MFILSSIPMFFSGSVISYVFLIAFFALPLSLLFRR